MTLRTPVRYVEPVACRRSLRRRVSIGVPRVRSVAVLGAGTMGAQIAGHFANAGIPALLLDLDADVARAGLKRATTLKPDPFFTRDTLSLIRTGGFETDLAQIADCDWIIEAVVEQLDVKRGILERVDGARRPGTIVSSNTSGISITALAEGRSDDFRTHWLGTHFFNPPRYLRLLEVIPTSDTDPAIVEAVSRFADHRLGKGVVIAKDTPGFIANHVGLYGVMRALDALASGRYSVEEIDAITGPPLGRPKSATFRTMDIAGLDILAHVVADLRNRLPERDRSAFAMTPLLVGPRRTWVSGREVRPWLLQAADRSRRGERDSRSESFDPRLRAAPFAANWKPRCRPQHHGCRRAGAQAVFRRRLRRRISERDAGANPRLHGASDARHRALHR